MAGQVVRFQLPEEMRRIASQILDDEAAKDHLNAGGGDSGGTDEMSIAERLSRLEGGYEGLKQSQSILKAGVMGFGAFVLAAVALVIALQVFTYSRIDRVESKVDALPGEVRTELQGIANSLAAAITAAKQSPPQIIVLPTPNPAPHP